MKSTRRQLHAFAWLVFSGLIALALPFEAAGQVYSGNVVGYVNVPVGTNRYHLIANPLRTTNDTLNTVLPSAPAGSRVWIWDVASQRFVGPAVYSPPPVLWSTNFPIPVGKGFMFHTSTYGTLTFVGEVLQGALSNGVAGANRLSLLGSMVPQAGAFSTTLAFPPSDGDSVYQFSTAAQSYFDARSFYLDYDSSWHPNEPTLAVAEGFFVQHPGADKAWLRNFTVNRPVDSNPPPPEPSPQIESFAIRDGMVTLKINKMTKRYNVQFSTDRVNWTTIAVNQTAATWKGSLPPAPAGFFQVVKS